MKNFIELSDISFSYKSGSCVIRDFNLVVPEKSFFCFLGPSGCGKSTLLKIISSMILPDKGVLKIKGKKTDKPDPERIIVFQDDNQLFPWLTTLQNVSLPLLLLKKSGREEKGQEYLKQVYLEKYGNYYPYQLSGGMKKRAIIARALAGSPDILLLDEPFSSLDAQTRISLHKLIYSLWEKSRITVIFVTHDIDEALTLSTDIAVMKKNGQISALLKNHLSGNFDYASPSFFQKRKVLYDMIETPDM